MRRVQASVEAIILNYAAFVNGMSGLIVAHLGVPNPFGPANQQGFKLAIDQLVLDNYSLFDRQVSQDIGALQAEAYSASVASDPRTMRLADADALQRLRVELESASRGQYHALLQSDRDALWREFGAASWRYSKLIAAGVKQEKAIETVRASAAPGFGILDRAGRRWSGGRFIEVTIGYNFYRAWNETTMYAAIVDNRDSILIKGQDEEDESVSLEDVSKASERINERLHIGSKRWLEVA